MPAVRRTAMRRDPRTLLTAALLSVAVALAATACGDAAGDDARAAAGPSRPTAGTSARPQTPTTSGGRMTQGLSGPVTLVRSGGVGGLQDRVQVRPDGTVTVTTKGNTPLTRQLDEGQLAAIVQAVEQADLASLGQGTTTPTRSDELVYTLSAQGRTYRTSETQAPAEVQALLTELGALLSAPAPTP